MCVSECHFVSTYKLDPHWTTLSFRLKTLYSAADVASGLGSHFFLKMCHQTAANLPPELMRQFSLEGSNVYYCQDTVYIFNRPEL